MDSHTFNLVAGDSGLSTETIAACRRVLVECVSVTVAAADKGTSLSGLSQAVSKLRRRAPDGVAYVPKLDAVKAWLDLQTTKDADQIASTKELLRDFRACVGRTDITAVQFGELLTVLGFPRALGCDVSVRRGLRLTSVAPRESISLPVPAAYAAPTFDRETGPTPQFTLELAEARRQGLIARGLLPPDTPPEPRVRRVISDLSQQGSDDATEL